MTHVNALHLDAGDTNTTVDTASTQTVEKWHKTHMTQITALESLKPRVGLTFAGLAFGAFIVVAVETSESAR